MSFYVFGENVKYSIKNGLSSVDYSLIEDFSCGNLEIDNAIKRKNLDTYTVKVIIDNNRNCMIGFIAYQASGITLSYENTVITKPALQVGYFAIDSKYQHLPYIDEKTDDRYNLSDHIFNNFLKHFRKISEKILYLDYIILYSVPDAKSFYLRNCFEDFSCYMNSDKYPYLEGCSAMYMCI